MGIKELNTRANIDQDKKLTAAYDCFSKLITELNKREIPLETVNSINHDVELINSFSGSSKETRRQVRKIQSRILKLVEKELNLVTKNHYRNMWLAIGMATFGIPFGVVFGLSLGNMAFIGIGLPIGMAIGIAIGTAKDKQALENGSQLDIEIKH